MFNVLIVEDQRIQRELLEVYVKASNRYNLISSVSNADTAIAICKVKDIDLILMDVITSLGSNGTLINFADIAGNSEKAEKAD